MPRAASSAPSGLDLFPFPRTLLAPPAPPRYGILAREELLARLNRAVLHRLTLITAPAGYGKTVLLGQWLEIPILQEYGDVAWLTLDESTQDPVQLLSGLLHALTPHIPSGTLEGISALLATPGVGGRAPLIQLLNALDEAGRDPVLLVLDDVHTVTSSQEAQEILDQLLSYAPPRLHMIMATRHALTSPAIERLHARSQVLRLTVEDLRFTIKEVSELFAEVFEHPLNPNLLVYLYQHTEGWPVALTLLHQMGEEAMAETQPRMGEIGKTVSALYEYLATVVLAHQSHSTQTFLLTTSILENLDPDLCRALLPEETKVPPATQLARLERRGLFTSVVDAKRSVYRYHDLFREFLQRRLREERGIDAFRMLHRRAAVAYMERNNDEQAVRHLLAAEDHEAAADVIRALQSRLFTTSRYHLMKRWVEQLPPDLVEKHPWIILIRAKLTRMRGERARARQLYWKAEPHFRAQDDQEGLYDVYHDLASLTQSMGDFKKAQKFYWQGLEYAHDAVQRSPLLGQIAWCRYMEGEHTEEALRLLEEAVALASESGHTLARGGLLFLRGKILSSIGDFAGAMADWHTSQELLKTYGNRHQQILILNRLAYLQALLGNLDEVEPLIQQALELAEIYDRRTEYAFGLNVLGETRRRQGQYTQARIHHLKALDIQRELGERYETPATLNWLGLLARQMGNLNEAARYGEEGLALREALSNDYETGLSLIDVGATYLALGHLEKAEALWRRALDIFVAANARYEQIQIHFYLAVAAQHREDDEALLHHLKRSLDLAETFEASISQGFLHFYVEDGAWTAPLLARAVCLDYTSPTMERILRRLGQAALPELLTLLQDEHPNARVQAARLLGHIGHGAALKALDEARRDPQPLVAEAAERAIASILTTTPEPLRVQCLGRFHLWRGETEITRWQRSAARAVFQYLLVHRNHTVPMDVLIEILWPGSDPAQSRKNLNQAVAALRRALEPELASGMDSRYLDVSDGTYTLRLPPGSWVDFEAFEGGLRPFLDRQREAKPENAEALEATLALYEGDFLSEARYNEWTVLIRERLRTLYLTGLRILAHSHLTTGRPAAAIDAATRALEMDGWDEEAVLVLMRAHEAQGNLPAAIRAYERLCRRLRRDLDLPPRQDLTELYERLRRR